MKHAPPFSNKAPSLTEPEELTTRRKQLLYRATHRGSKEADSLLGPFARNYLRSCPEEEVENFATLLEAEEPELWDWIVDKSPPPAPYNTPAFQALKQFIATRK